MLEEPNPNPSTVIGFRFTGQEEIRFCFPEDKLKECFGLMGIVLVLMGTIMMSTGM